MDGKELRRLLELAAKAAQAAGANIIDSEAGPQIFERHAGDGSECYRIWPPHLDDGDSRRLEVALEMRVMIWPAGAEATKGTSISVFVRNDEAGCPYAATRLAVLRAAAAIGEAMP